jgi:tRNA (cmo5U34)-methyltransferase
VVHEPHLATHDTRQRGAAVELLAGHSNARRPPGSEWKDPERAESWPATRQALPHAPDAEQLLVDYLITGPVTRILDLGTGGGHLIALLKGRWPAAAAVGLDLSPQLVNAARQRLAGASDVTLDVHDLMEPLPDSLGRFDLVVSSLAIHHLPDKRKRTLFAEVFDGLADGGAFYDLDVVASPTADLHALSQRAFGFDARDQDPSDQPAALEGQLTWLQDAGFKHVDCFWKWLELALVGGGKPPAS